MNLRITIFLVLICCCLICIIPVNAYPLMASEGIIHTGIVAGSVIGLTTVAGNDSTITTLVSNNSTSNVTLVNVADTTLKSQITINGQLIDERIIGPGLPPEGWVGTSNLADFSDISTQSIDTGNVPAMRWSYGCSATSATMLFGYYDRTGYSNMYVGPTNGGVFPLNNSAWGASFESSNNGQCPLTASQYGLDGRTTYGHKNDYYSAYGSITDPYYGSWTEHTPLDCIADYMGTNMYQKYGNSDGSTTFYYYTDGSPLYDFTSGSTRDGMHGMRLFAESRGYSVTTNYNQYIYGYNGNTLGFTYTQYKAEIDAGYPVLIQVAGHTMLGVGYSGTNTVILHDTWDYSSHTMTWGGTYSTMQHYGVGVIHLKPVPVTAKFYGVPGVTVNPLTIQFYDASIGSASSWSWDFGDGGNSTEKNPSHQFNNSGTYMVNLTVES